MKRTSILRSSKVTRVLFGAFAIFVIFTMIGAGCFQGIAPSSKKEAGAGYNAAVRAQSNEPSPQAVESLTFTNSAGITINTAGTATPYPSNIVVSGISPNATVASITVTINGFSHTIPDDVDMLLVAPDTTKRLIFWSDVGGNVAVSNVNVTISYAAAAQLPDSTAITAGTFKPTDQSVAQTDNFPLPAPCDPSGNGCSPTDGAAPRGTATLTNRFVGTIAAGTWSLYVRDDTAGDGGSITSWSITLTFASPTVARMSGGSATVDDDGQVSLKWQTSYEVDNLGFNVYRDEGGQRTRVNKQLIAGSAFLSGRG